MRVTAFVFYRVTQNNVERTLRGKYSLCFIVDEFFLILTSSLLPNPLFSEPAGAHDLDDVEAGPADVVAQHLEVGQLGHGVRLHPDVGVAELLLDLLQASCREKIK